MKNRTVFLAISAAAISLCSPQAALADWQYTKWGMSQEEVVAAAGATGSTLKAINKPGYAGRILVGPYNSGRFSFQATFYFPDRDGGKLASVRLELENKDTCRDLSLALESAYGSAPQISENPAEKDLRIRRGRWSDKEKNNLVTFFYPPERYSDPCWVHYSELVKPGATQGL